ncbi:hypothetical protein J7J18_03265 [bacterium]|nr:hypothetical protein [bacterium]
MIFENLIYSVYEQIMSKQSPKRRKFIIKKKQKRRRKLKKLKEKYLKTKDPEEKRKILAKMRKIAPYLEIEKYL